MSPSSPDDDAVLSTEASPFLPIQALGAIVRIDLTGMSEDESRAVRAAWSDAAADDDGGGALTIPARAAASIDLSSMLGSLSQRVTLAAIEARRGELWMLHAAGVADDAGRVVALVGPSGRGKTTAALALGARFAYVSDETVAIGADGRVWPYRKPLSVIEDPLRPKAQRTASDSGLRALPDGPLTLAAIAVLDRRDDGPDMPFVEHEDLGDALGDLVAQSSYLPEMERPLATIAAHAAAVGGVRHIVYREAESLGPAVAALLADVSVGGPDSSTSSGTGVGTDPVLAAPVAGTPPVAEPVEASHVTESQGERWSRTPVRDELALPNPDRIAVLQVDDGGAGTVRVLAGIAPAVWRAADAASLGELTDAAVAAHGTPETGDAAALVRATVDALVAVRLLEALSRG